MSHNRVCISVILVCCLCIAPVWSEEPNETFGEATVLAPGVFYVEDGLAPPLVAIPDTYLGTLGFLGGIELENDDDSIYGDGLASGLTEVPISPGGTIDFLVTGYDDFGFTGNHSQSGEYEVVVEVYDLFGDYVDTITEVRVMEPGVVEQFSYAGDFTWISGSYDVNIDNLIGLITTPSDVDFFTFTGLTAGAAFSAEVTQSTVTSFDSILGWFDETGMLIESDDDSAGNGLSLIDGVVPDSGTLTFAVTGFDDFDFLGIHTENDDYTLQLTVAGSSTPGDFDGDGDVDGRDFLIWQRGDSPVPLSAVDLADWQTNYGDGAPAALTVVPEPGTFVLLATIAVCLGIRQRCS